MDTLDRDRNIAAIRRLMESERRREAIAGWMVAYLLGALGGAFFVTAWAFSAFGGEESSAPGTLMFLAGSVLLGAVAGVLAVLLIQVVAGAVGYVESAKTHRTDPRRGAASQARRTRRPDH